MDNRLITFEGIDGSGKSTQIKLLNQWFESLGLNVTNIREPGGGNVSETIRSILLDASNSINFFSETLLFLASRAQLVDEIIIPALKKDEFVICDRFIDSTVVYQGYGRSLGVELIDKINFIATQGIVPGLTIYIDISVELSINRRIVADNDRMESGGKEFLLNVKKGYDDMANLYPDRIVVINGDGSIESIQNNIRNVIKDKFRGLLC